MKLGARISSLLAVTIVALFFILLLQHRQSTPRNRASPQNCPLDEEHWICRKIKDARDHTDKLQISQATDLPAAADAYRKRRGRHPPPGFDTWYQWAGKRDLIIIEQFFDQIHDDLELYWAVKPETIRGSIASWPSDMIQIRNGKVLDGDTKRFRTRTWAKMLKEISAFLPDLDMAINPLDEPRILAPEFLTALLRVEASKGKEAMMSLPIEQISSSFQHLDSGLHDSLQKRLDIDDVDSYHRALNACCPKQTTPSNVEKKDERYSFAAAKDICRQPELLSQHGFLIEPASISFSTAMIPVFSASKLSVNNDILLPEPAYYYDEFGLFASGGFWSRFGRSVSWRHKTHGFIWRGSATGGVPRADTWHQYHRHRFVMALNSSLHEQSQDRMRPQESLRQRSDVAFTGLSCDGRRNGEDCCSSLVSNFRLGDRIKMDEQYKWKYLPDIDGNSLSGRFRGFMLSESAPVKATIFKEWHDSRLVPWKHFIPLSIGFGEIYEIMAYFLGSERICAHDEDGERIAKEGQRWAERVLQKDDMLAYVWLVLLEYARVVDDERNRLGFVADLIDQRCVK